MLTSVYYNYQDPFCLDCFVCLFVCLFVPSEHWFLSCMVFSVYDVVRVACQSRSQFVL